MYVPRANDRLRGPLNCADTRAAAGQNHSCVLYAKFGSAQKYGAVWGPPQPEPAPKRRRIASLDEDTLPPPPVEPANDNLSRDLRDFVHENWASVRTHVARGPVQTRFNQRLTTTYLRVLNQPLRVLFDQQTTAFKINFSYGFVLREKQSGRLRYYHASNNCCGRFFGIAVIGDELANFQNIPREDRRNRRPAVGHCPAAELGLGGRTSDQRHVLHKSHRTSPYRLCRYRPARLREK